MGFSSVHIQLPTTLANTILLWGNKNIPEKEIFVDTSNDFYGREQDPHITILYGLHTNNESHCCDLIKNQKKFEVVLKEMFLFRRKDFNVLAIRVESNILYELNRKLKKLPHTNRHQYIPHITIAYLAKPTFGNFSNQKFIADNFVFSTNSFKKKFNFI